VDAVGAVLSRYRDVVRMRPPGSLDGGDVLVVGRTMFVGRSLRTNDEGVAQLRRIVTDHVDRVVAVPVERCLHLKSAVTPIGDETLLIDPEWIDDRPFRAYRLVPVHPSETGAANALRIGDCVVFPEEYPETARRIENAGVEVLAVPAGELAKAEGGVTCCSVVFAGPPSESS
jgi:dimethylargininase